MTLREIRINTVFGIVVIQAKKPNRRRGLPGSQRNPEGALVLHKDQP